MSSDRARDVFADVSDVSRAAATSSATAQVLDFLTTQLTSLPP